MPSVSRRRFCRTAAGLVSAGVIPQGLSATVKAGETGTARPRARSCVFIFLFGGPSHIDLWDMKPEAPAEIRGDFRPVDSNVPGLQLCEHLPLLARQAHRLCLMRSMTHRMPVHGPACSEIYSGRPYFGAPVTDQARPEDWPSVASLVHRFGQQSGAMPHSVVLPWYTQFVGQDRRIAGQTGARMGEEFNPFLVQGDLTAPDFHVDGLALPEEIPVSRFRARWQLRQQMQSFGLAASQQSSRTRMAESHFAAAAELVERTEAAGVLDLSRETDAVRDHYGRSRFGQSLLLARRLVEAEVSLVTVNWDDVHRDDKVSPHWDTHDGNFPKLKDRLCPPFDRGLSAFLADLDERGLLESTLVVALGEFGRTPRIGLVTQNGMTEKTGRDHWPHAFTCLVAGGGVAGGQIYGATTASGGYVADDPVTPADLAATVFAHLGISNEARYFDHFLQRQQPLSTGRVIELA